MSGSTIKTLTNHYDDAGGDSPAWIAEDSAGTNWTANVTDLLGSLAATVDQAGAATFTYANLHGDVQATCTAGASAPTISPDIDEYGNTPPGSSVTRYGWLGAKQRSAEDLAGVVLMGVRLYNPSTGRFLSVDPVVGGNANAYGYPEDPVNMSDLDGRTNGGIGGDLADIAHKLRCEALLVRIFAMKNKVSRRARQLLENKRFWSAQDEDRINHLKALRSDQRGLRNLLNEFDRCGCGNGPGGLKLPKGVWKLATRDAPAINAHTVATAAAGAAVAGGILWWLGKLAAPACGPGAPVCLVVL